MKNKLWIAAATLLMVSWNARRPVPVEDKWKALPVIKEGGFLGQRLDLWRNHRLWYVYNSEFLLQGFEHPPGEHLWQGEHAGKWLHAAVLDYETTKDPKLLAAMDDVANRLIKVQAPNGYIGTYIEDKRFYKQPADKTGWDIWTSRYVLYGLLAYEKHHPNSAVLNACKKLGDLLIDTYGEEMNDITKYGTRQGLSSTTLLESIVMLYERTKEQRYLDFAEQIVTWSDANPRLRLMDAMLKNESVVKPGDGKAYQLMSNLLGYYRLYKCTNDTKYLQTVLNAWQQIQKDHVLSTGGPWTRKTNYNGNKECFANKDAFDPWEIVVENCVTTTWIQLNLHLLDLTGDAKYADEAEKSLFNHFAGGQEAGGIDWCYYSKPNETTPPYVSEIHCCASSGPRAIEMFARRLASQSEGNIAINNFSTAQIQLDTKQGGGQLQVKSNFPYNGLVEIMPEPVKASSFTISFRMPVGTALAELKVNGQKASAEKNEHGYYSIARSWKKGDKITVAMDYQLKSQVQEGADGKKWVAFTYGPLALAEKITSKPAAEPFSGMKDDGSLLQQLKPINAQQGRFEIKGSGIVLAPYAEAGSRSSGPRTYFQLN